MEHRRADTLQQREGLMHAVFTAGLFLLHCRAESACSVGWNRRPSGYFQARYQFKCASLISERSHHNMIDKPLVPQATACQARPLCCTRYVAAKKKISRLRARRCQVSSQPQPCPTPGGGLVPPTGPAHIFCKHSCTSKPWAQGLQTGSVVHVTVFARCTGACAVCCRWEE